MKIEPVTLIGGGVRLEPLSETHISDLARVGTDSRIWQFTRYPLVRTAQDVGSWVMDMLELQAKGHDLPFAVIHLDSGRTIGATRYLDIQPEHRNLEIGGTWYGIDFQGTGVNTACKFLLLSHAFEHYGCIRVFLKTDARNSRSQRAIEKLGAVKEGVVRNHLILPDGTVRSSVFYSILAEEWPAVKADLESRLPS